MIIFTHILTPVFFFVTESKAKNFVSFLRYFTDYFSALATDLPKFSPPGGGFQMKIKNKK